MLKIEIHESTPANMLRAIRAACNELLGETTAASPIPEAVVDQYVDRYREAMENLDRQSGHVPDNVNPTPQNYAAGAHENVEKAHGAAEALGGGGTPDQYLVDEPPSAPETDSSGAEWNPELHASTKTKNADGTWKKRRGPGKADGISEDFSGLEKRALEMQTDEAPISGATAGRLTETVPERQPLPPLPPAPPAADTVTMNQIWALITNGQSTLDKVLAAAQAMGFADLGAVAQTATAEQRAELFKELTK